MYVPASIQIGGDTLALITDAVQVPSQADAWNRPGTSPVSVVVQLSDGQPERLLLSRTCVTPGCRGTADGWLFPADGDQFGIAVPSCQDCRRNGYAVARLAGPDRARPDGWFDYAQFTRTATLPVADGEGQRPLDGPDPLTAHLQQVEARITTLLADEAWRHTIGAHLSDDGQLRIEVFKALGRIEDMAAFEHWSDFTDLYAHLPADVIGYAEHLAGMQGKPTPLDRGAKRLLAGKF